jgi:hypothetical protein
MFNLRFVKDWMLHRLKAKNRHGLHSPFVYRLVDKVIYDFRAKNIYPAIEVARKQLVKSAITKTGSANSIRVDELIYRLVTDLKPNSIAQFGQVPTTTKLYIQKAASEAKIYTIMENKETYNGLESLDLVIINGDSNYQVLKHFEVCLPNVHDNTMLIINGIYCNEEIKQAWSAIKANPKVTVTVDLFWIGLVFFRKGQVKENFRIKF